MARVKGIDWDLEGEQLTIKWALALCYFVGFRGVRLVSAVALMSAESVRWTRAWNKNYDSETGALKSTDRGLFQINDFWHPSLSDEAAYRPIPNAMYARKMSSRGRFWGAWAAFDDGKGVRYLEYLPIVTAVWALGTWKKRVDKVERRFA